MRRELRKWRREGGMEEGIKRKRGSTERYMREKKTEENEKWMRKARKREQRDKYGRY